jgi:RNA polymerase sigma factor (sigma-70 family)
LIRNLISSQQLSDLIEQHADALVLFARQWCSDPDDAVQEALIELVRLDQFPRDPAAWLFTTTKRRAINQTRSNSRRRKRDFQSRGNDNRSRESAVNQAAEFWFQSDLESREEVEKLQAQLQQLPPLDREIVVAHIWGALSFTQIAELVGRSASSVHRHYQGALEKLRKGWECPAELPPGLPETGRANETSDYPNKNSNHIPCSGLKDE